MANIPESPVWADGVKQIETTDKVLGGPDGVVNQQAKNLADRTAFLKQEVEGAQAAAAAADDKAQGAIDQISAVEAAAGSAQAHAADALTYRDEATAAAALALQHKNSAEGHAESARSDAAYAADVYQFVRDKSNQVVENTASAVNAASAAVAARDSVVSLGDAKKSEIVATANTKKAEINTIVSDATASITALKDATVAAKGVAEAKALVASDSAVVANEKAAVATTGAGTATTQAGLAATAKTAAEAARDAALIQAGVYVDEPTGRAAVANGVAFKVQGSGEVAAYEYRRVSSSSSTLIATYPAKAAYDGLKTIVGNGPKTGTFSAALTFDDDEIVDSYLQTAAITFTLAASGHKLGVSKRITVIGDGSGISFGFTVGVQQGSISPTKVNSIYMVYVGNSTVDLHIVNSDSALTDTTNLLALVQADSATKLTLSGSNVSAMIDQSPQQSNFAVVGTMPYDAAGKYISTLGARFNFTTRTLNKGNFTLVIAGRFKQTVEKLEFIGTASGSLADYAQFVNGFVDDLFGRGIFQGYTDAISKIAGDSIIVMVGTPSTFRIYINNVLVAEKTTGGPYSGTAALKALLYGNEISNISKATRLYEFRALNKAYLDAVQLTQLYNDVKNRYAIDPTIYPTASSLTYTGSPVAGSTITAAWSYNQGSAGVAGDYRVEWRYDSTSGRNFFYGINPKNAMNDPVSPTLVSGKYYRYRLTIQDDQGRCSKVAYESAEIYVA